MRTAEDHRGPPFLMGRQHSPTAVRSDTPIRLRIVRNRNKVPAHHDGGNAPMDAHPATDDMTDDDFVRAFESYELPPDSFRHKQHLRLAWLYLRRLPYDAAA